MLHNPRTQVSRLSPSCERRRRDRLMFLLSCPNADAGMDDQLVFE